MDRAVGVNGGLCVARGGLDRDGHIVVALGRQQRGKGVGRVRILAVGRLKRLAQRLRRLRKACLGRGGRSRIDRERIVARLYRAVGVRNRGGERHGLHAGGRQRDRAVGSQHRRGAAGIGDRIAVTARGQRERIRGADGAVGRQRGCYRVKRDAENILRPDGIELVDLVVFAAVVPVVVFKITVDGRLIGILDRRVIRRLAPAGKLVALALERAGRQFVVHAEWDGHGGHLAGHAALVAVSNVKFDLILIVSPVGIEHDLGFGEDRVLRHALAALFGGIPAVERLVGRVAVLRQVGQILADGILAHGLVRDLALVAVAVKMDGDALLPVRIERHGRGVGELGLVGNLRAALRRVEPAEEDVARAGGIGDLVVAGAAVFVDVVIVIAHNAGAHGRLGAVVAIHRHLHRLTGPDGVELHDSVVLRAQVLDGRAVGILHAAAGSRGVPAAEVVARAGEGVGRQRLLGVIGEGLRGHLARAAVGQVLHGVGVGRPRGRIGRVGRNDRVRRQRGVAGEPAAERIAGARRLRDGAGADGRVARDGDRGVGCCAVVIGKGDGVRRRPDGVEIHRLRGVELRAVGVSDFPVRCCRPAGEHAVRLREGVELERGLTVEILRVVVAHAAVGMEGDDRGLARREVADIDAVVEFVAAAVLCIGQRQHLAGLGRERVGLPAEVAALFDLFRPVIGDGEAIVLGLGRDLVLKCELCVCGKGQLQGAAGSAFSGSAGLEHIVPVQRGHFPFVRAVRGAGLRLGVGRDAFKEALEARLVRRQCRWHEAEHHCQHQQQGQ